MAFLKLQYRFTQKPVNVSKPTLVRTSSNISITFQMICGALYYHKTLYKMWKCLKVSQQNTSYRLNLKFQRNISTETICSWNFLILTESIHYHNNCQLTKLNFCIYWKEFELNGTWPFVNKGSTFSIQGKFVSKSGRLWYLRHHQHASRAVDCTSRQIGRTFISMDVFWCYEFLASK